MGFTLHFLQLAAFFATLCSVLPAGERFGRLRAGNPASAGTPHPLTRRQCCRAAL